MGQVLKGTNQTVCLPQRKTPYRKNQQRSLKYPDKDPNANTCQFSEDVTRQGGGAHGPPCYFWGDTPADCGTEGSEDPPTTGTAPGGARTNIMPNKIRSEPQKHCGPALRRLLYFQESNKQNQTRQTYSIADNIHTDTQMFPHNAHTTSHRESRCPGEPTRRGLGQSSPLSPVSAIAAISGVRDGHRNRKSQKSLRFRCAKSRDVGCSDVSDL